MNEFLNIATSFPTAVYTVLLLVVTVHWLLAALGILEVDSIDGLMPDGFGAHGAGHDIGHGHGHGAHHHDTDAGSAGGLLMKFGLHGVPVMVVFTIIAIVGWSFCFFVEQYVLSALPLGAFTVPAEIATLVGGLLVSIPVARLVLSPVRRLLRRFAPISQRPMLGRYGVVRSPEITQGSGTVEIDDGGAGLILQVRADISGRFVRGDRVVLIEYLEEHNAYRVVSGDEFERL